MWLCCLAGAGFMTWLWVMHAFAPLYITNVTKNSATFAGLIMGASGLGSFLWSWILPWLSDYAGRRATLLMVALISGLVPLTYQSAFLVEHPWLMAMAGLLPMADNVSPRLRWLSFPPRACPRNLQPRQSAWPQW